MTTVRELEKKLNVSRVSIYALLKKDPYKEHVVIGKKNVIMLSNAGADLLKSYYQNKNRGGKPRNNVILFESGECEDQAGTAAGASDIDVVSVLQQQLAKKDEQIDNLLGILSSQKSSHA